MQTAIVTLYPMARSQDSVTVKRSVFAQALTVTTTSRNTASRTRPADDARKSAKQTVTWTTTPTFRMA